MRARLLPIVVAAACGTESAATPTTAVFEPDPPADDFYALPFPNDVWRKPDGTLDLSRVPTASELVDVYRAAAEQLDGFGKNQAMFARIDGAIDPASLPDAAASLEPSAAVYLVDVDPDSSHHGERVPIAVRFRATGTATLPGAHVVARPVPGFPLADATTYALVITSRARDLAGTPIAAPPGFAAVLDGSAPAAVQTAYGPLLTWLDEPGDDERADVVSAAVFTTQRATAIAPALRRAIFAGEPPVAADVTSPATNAVFQTFTGTYTAPNFQSGDPPYRDAPSGEIQIGADGAAIVQRMEAMRFALTVPPGEPPASGFPVAIYSHGTGGDFQSFINDGTAGALAKQGLAVISTDQVLHGPRNPGGNPEIDFFNFTNPFAMRDNVLQGAADAWSQLRLLTTLSIEDGGRTITFDPTRVYFFGHSQGGLTGPGFVAFEPTLTGAVLSGTGGVLYLALLHKTAPVDIPSLVQAVLRDDPVDEDNPSLAIFQMWAERADGVNYAPLMVREPAAAPDGGRLARRNVFQTEGFTDSFTPNPSIEAFATALGGDIVQTPDAAPVEGLTLRGRAIVAPPFDDNVEGVTAALAQYVEQPGSDGHFVVFDIPLATRQAAEFLGTLARTGTATVVTGP